ncbi:MAG: ATP-dependent DNA helicase RecG [Verrucomicrobia bacterium]|nr:ATP-dependent DNA helicase RecG [Verrucomicrobiota bacterium]
MRVPNVPTNPLQTPLTSIRGVGPERAAQLARLDLHTVEDLLLHKPRRYEDRRHFKKIKEVKLGEATTVFGKIAACGLKTFARGTKSVFEVILKDETGHLHCRWWNLPFMEKYFRVGDDVLAFGKVKGLKPRTIDHPETEVLEPGEEISIHLNRIAPIYPLTEGLPQRWLRALVWRVLHEFEEFIEEPALTLPTFPGRANAVHMLHFPSGFNEAEAARKRLALDEFVVLQHAIQLRRKKLEANAKGLPCSGTNQLIKQFLAALSFQLTDAQTKVLREIRTDMGSKVPMRRLLQGDVGSGKTVVAACSALMAIENGFNVALMAPTEILATQHFQNFRRWFSDLKIRVELLTGSFKTVTNFGANDKSQPTLLAATSSSQPATLYIGTHALVESAFMPQKLGLVVIDEQHKFGVAQREKLVRKGNYPHLLVMTATPIPRSLGLTLYGDLDMSVIDQLPAGRGKIKTYVRAEDKLPKIWDFIRQKITEGRQAYIVYPRVEDSGVAGDLKAVTAEYEKLKKIFAPHPVGLLHGRIKAEEKEHVMNAFRHDRVKVLIATSVIEVGVDVPNASVMVIENSERFGLAQLHQLRGRIGRGAHDSFCVLVTPAKNEEAMERLQILEDTNDGFKIADEDLRLRGPGELLGTQQSGMPKLRFGDLVQDRMLVERARTLVRESLSKI